MALLALTFSEWIAAAGVAFAAVAYGIRESLDLIGKSPSSRRLRDENVDLIRRNQELDQTVSRLEAEVRELRQEVAGLRSRDQTAVLERLERDHVETTALLREIRDALRNR